MPPSAPGFVLRVPTASDAEAWFALFDDPEIMRYISGGVTRNLEWYRAFAERQRILAASTGLCLFALVVPDAAADGFAGAADSAGVGGSAGAAGVGGSAGADGSAGAAGVGGSAGADRSTGAAGSADSGGAVAGFVGLQPWSRPWGPVGRIEIGWRLGSGFHGRGLATSGAREALRRAASLGVTDPVAMIDDRNTASIAVATKLGMTALTPYESPEGATVDMYGFASA